MMKRDRYYTMAAAAIIVLSSVLCGLSLVEGISWDGDYGAYIRQGMSLVTGSVPEFISVCRAISEHSDLPCALVYTWGTPALFAFVYAFFGVNIMAFKVFGVVCFISFLIVLWRQLEGQLSNGMRVAALGLFAFNPMMILFLNNVGSDLPFLVVSTMALTVFAHWRGTGDIPGTGFRQGVVLGILLGLAPTIRPNGILLAVALGVTHGLPCLIRFMQGPSRDKKIFLRQMTPYLCALVILIAYALVVPMARSSNALLFTCPTLRTLIQRIPYHLWVWVDFYRAVPFSPIIFGMSLIFVLIGAVHSLKRDAYLVAYVVLTMALYLVWPYQQGIRFMYPILPVFVYFMLKGIELSKFGFTTFRPGLGKVMAAIFISVLVLANLRAAAHFAQRNAAGKVEFPGPFDKDSGEMFDFARKTIPKDASVGIFCPQVFWLRTDHVGYIVNHYPRPDGGPDFMIMSVDWAFPYQPTPAVIEAEVAQRRLELLWGNKTYTVYRKTPRSP
jgi:hypothetical protein